MNGNDQLKAKTRVIGFDLDECVTDPLPSDEPSP